MIGGRAKAPAAVLALFALGAWTAASCNGRAPAADAAPSAAGDAVPCAPAAGALFDGGRADRLAGDFRLTLVATRGPRQGRSASGRLVLRAFDGAARPVPAAAGVRFPLYGGAELSVDSVGAVVPGDIRAADATRPGVLVMEWRRATPPPPSDQITLRFGADANRAGPDRFDGAHLALSIATSSPDRFAGIWDSGAGDQQAGGYFCAQRVGTG